MKPSEKSNKKIRERIGATLQGMGHCKVDTLVRELNATVRGWLSYFDIRGVSYSFVAKRELNYYLRVRLNRYFNRKSQRKSRLYRKQAFELLVSKYGLIDPLRYQPRLTVNA